MYVPGVVGLNGVDRPRILNLKRTFERYLFKLRRRLRSTFNIKHMHSRVRVQPPLISAGKSYRHRMVLWFDFW